ncbi:hypothetical protein HYALB_00001577 [Hymenoscyphus albidus]|uniref:Uncharacterized protein n=1 Tax=Hymenoscyphus albidus TaxID=595503 RepID=A0A9N9L948_9HELO|nr:hypothetical protein HYALB_00001577 [Hymenoscyphus albidus]
MSRLCPITKWAIPGNKMRRSVFILQAMVERKKDLEVDVLIASVPSPSPRWGRAGEWRPAMKPRKEYESTKWRGM